MFYILKGTKSPDALFQKLEDAIRRKDKRALDKAIRECVASGLPELDDAIQKSRRFSDILGGGKGGLKKIFWIRIFENSRFYEIKITVALF